MTSLILGAVGQQADYDPPRPIAAAPTWVLEDMITSDELDSGTAQVNAAVLITDALAGWAAASATKIPVAATAGAEIGPAWIESPDGQAELVEVEGWIDDEYLRIKRPLTANYEPGAEIRFLRVRAAIDDAVTANEDLVGRKLWIVWSYDQDGPRRVPQAISLSRRSEGDLGVTAAITWAGGMFPELNDQARANGNEIDTMAKFAKGRVEDQLRSDGKGIVPANIIAGPRGPEIVGLQLLLIAAANGIHPARQKLEAWTKFVREEYRRVYDALVIGDPGAGATEVDDDGRAVQTAERAVVELSW